MIDQFAQITSPFGIKPIKSIIAAPFNATTVEFIIPSTDATPVYINDLVRTVDNSDSLGNEFGIEYCARATSSSSIRGVVVDFKVIHEYENSVYRAASTRRVVRVCQDPFLLCQARVNAVILATDVNRFLDIDSGTGNAVTGLSAVQLDYATINDAGGQFRITKILNVVDTDEDKYTIVECVIQKHEFLEGVVSSGDLFDRVGTTIIPHNAGDDLDMGTGNVSGTDGDFSGDLNVDGKLTVAGLIDPTGIILTPQAVAPSTDNGTIYYDSIGNVFNIRQNGSWEIIASQDYADNLTTYTNASVTTATVGGIPAGSTFFNTAKTYAETTQQTYFPYVVPTFTAFAIGGIGTQEVGKEFTDLQTFTWTISDPTHAAANSINIYDTELPQTLVTGHSVTSPATFDFNTLPGGMVRLILPGNYVWRIEATNTNVPSATFTRNFTGNWYWLLHYGTSTNTSLTEAQILALAGSLLTPTTARTYNFAAGGFKYLCVNEDLPQPTSFKDASTNLNIPFEAAVTVSVTNAYSITSNYKVYRSTNIMGAAVSIIVA